jgi:type I restriction enzyme M protein
MHISEQNIDVQGDLYEYLLMQLTTAGKNGQFRTPRHIIRMIVKLVDPKVGDRICDPAAGTGGFLVNAYEHILESNTSPDVLEYDSEGKPHHLIGDKIADKKLLKFLKSQALTGYDFDATMTRIGAMNLMLHGIDNPNFRYMDALSKTFTEKAQYDIILANPPFKGSIDKSDINERFSVKTTKTELLFIELMYDLLVTGGRCGVIVPDGVLFGSSNAHVDLRKILVDKCKMEGVISMPSGVFKPYAGVSTAMLVFQKGGTTDNVWFYDMEADGFSLDDKRQKVTENDILDIIAKWKERNKSTISNRKSKFFIVPADEIRSNKYDLSISRYKQIVHKEIEYEKPEMVMKKVLELEKEIEVSVAEIQSMLR